MTLNSLDENVLHGICAALMAVKSCHTAPIDVFHRCSDRHQAIGGKFQERAPIG